MITFKFESHDYLRDHFDGIYNFYKVNTVGALTPTMEIQPHNILPLPISEVDKTIFSDYLNLIHKEYRYSLRAIGNTLGWTPPEEDHLLSGTFIEWVSNNQRAQITELNLSNLGMKTLPPQMRLFDKLENLNLTGNELIFLPPELQRLPLKTLNISSNPLLQPNMPEWFGKMREFKLIAYGINLTFLPIGLKPDQVECEIALHTYTSL